MIFEKYIYNNSIILKKQTLTKGIREK